MYSKTELLKEIERLTGRTLVSDQWTLQDLNELKKVAGASLLPAPRVVPIPLKPIRQCADPRSESLDYQQLLFTSPDRAARIQAAGLRYEPLHLVLSLEGTLLSIIDESPSATLQSLQSHPNMQPLYDSLYTAVVPALSKSVLIAVRPRATEFLAALQAIGRLFLISKLPHKLVQAVLTTVGWTSLFEDVICSSEQWSISGCFPRLADTRSLMLIFDSRLEQWDRDDQRYVIPSKRYLALERLSATGPLLLTYSIDGEKYHTEHLSPAAYSLFEVDPNSHQLVHIADRLKSVSFELFRNRYQCDARAVFTRTKSTPRTRAYVDIPNLTLKIEAIAIAKAVGLQVVDILAQADLIVQAARTVRAEGRTETWSGLVQRYFNVGGK